MIMIKKRMKKSINKKDDIDQNNKIIMIVKLIIKLKITKIIISLLLVIDKG